MIKTCKSVISISSILVGTSIFWQFSNDKLKVDGSLYTPECTILIPIYDCECEELAGISASNNTSATTYELVKDTGTLYWHANDKNNTVVLKQSVEAAASGLDRITLRAGRPWTVDLLMKYIFTTNPQSQVTLSGDMPHYSYINNAEMSTKLRGLITAGTIRDTDEIWYTPASADAFFTSTASGLKQGTIKFKKNDLRTLSVTCERNTKFLK